MTSVLDRVKAYADERSAGGPWGELQRLDSFVLTLAEARQLIKETGMHEMFGTPTDEELLRHAAASSFRCCGLVIRIEE